MNGLRLSSGTVLRLLISLSFVIRIKRAASTQQRREKNTRAREKERRGGGGMVLDRTVATLWYSWPVEQNSPCQSFTKHELDSIAAPDPSKLFSGGISRERPLGAHELDAAARWYQEFRSNMGPETRVQISCPPSTRNHLAGEPIRNDITAPRGLPAAAIHCEQLARSALHGRLTARSRSSVITALSICWASGTIYTVSHAASVHVHLGGEPVRHRFEFVQETSEKSPSVCIAV